jgi:tetratricopeptide (TPR) repeat protein
VEFTTYRRLRGRLSHSARPAAYTSGVSADSSGTLPPEAHHRRGLHERRRGDLVSALASFQMALGAQDEDVLYAAWHNIGQIERALGRRDKAEEAFLRASSSSNDDIASGASIGLAHLLLQRGDVLGALHYYSLAALSGNDDIGTRAAAKAGRICMELAKTDEAARFLRRACSSPDPDTARLAQECLRRLLTQSTHDNVKGLPTVTHFIVCRRGHVELVAASDCPYCSRCGLEVLVLCPVCSRSIEPQPSPDWIARSAFCPGCGEPYPWASFDQRVDHLYGRLELESLSSEEYDKALSDIATLVKEPTGDLEAVTTGKRRALASLRLISPAVSRIAEKLVTEFILGRLPQPPT